MTLKWTRTPPTEAGWYWLQRRGDPPEMVEVWAGSSGELLIGESCVPVSSLLHPDDVRWSGPIPPPEEAS